MQPADPAARGTVVVDLDGVVYVGGEPVPGAGEALQRMEDDGYAVLFATNNASRTTQAAAAKIAAVSGYPARPDQLVTAALAAGALLSGGERCFIVGGAGLHEAVTRAGGTVTDVWRDADVVLTGFSHDITYPALRDATLAIRNGSRFIASNDDATFPAPDGQWPGAGATVAFLVTATSVRPEIAGKPHHAIRRIISSRLAAGPVWMVGDRPETDLAMAKAEGWISVLALSGVTSAVDDLPADQHPDLAIRSIADLPEVLGAG